MVSSPSSARSPTQGRGAGFSSPTSRTQRCLVCWTRRLKWTRSSCWTGRASAPGVPTGGSSDHGSSADCRGTGGAPRSARSRGTRARAEPCGDATRRGREAEARTVSRGAAPGGSEQALPSPALQTCRRSVARTYSKAHARESGPLRGFSLSTHLPQPPEAPPTPRDPFGPLSAQTHARAHARSRVPHVT